MLGLSRQVKICVHRGVFRADEEVVLPGSGSFTRLFNATKPPDDPLNSMGTPEGFVQLDISNSSKAEHPWFLSSGPIVSKSVKMAALHPSISGGGSYFFFPFEAWSHLY